MADKPDNDPVVTEQDPAKEQHVDGTIEEGKLYRIGPFEMGPQPGPRIMLATKVVISPHQAKVWLVPQ